jgi:hypothetical protein
MSRSGSDKNHGPMGSQASGIPPCAHCGTTRVQVGFKVPAIAVLDRLDAIDRMVVLDEYPVRQPSELEYVCGEPIRNRRLRAAIIEAAETLDWPGWEFGW